MISEYVASGSGMSHTIALPESKPCNPLPRSSWDKCQKNPGHKVFVPVKQFGLEHLPEEYRHEAVMTRIRLIADLVCRLFVGSKSIHRPKNKRLFCDVSKYRYGTGNVIEIIKTKLPRTQKCKICNSLHELTKGFYAIRIKTACHVVFDCKEAENTIIDLFYDDEVNLKDIKKLHGFCMVSRNIDEDQCVFECTTDDIDLVTLLESKLSSFKKLVSECSFIYSAPCNIMASHPHGMSKHISVGAWRDNDRREKLVQFLRNIRKRFFEFCHLYLLPYLGPDIVSNKPDKRKIFVSAWRYMDQHETLVQSGYFQSFIKTRFSGDSCCLNLSLLPYLEPVIFSNKPESEYVSVECEVFFPDKTTQKCHIWQFDEDVRCTKAFLIKEGNLPGVPDQFYLELDLPDEETQVMQDDRCLDYYINDLCKAYRIVVKRNNEIQINTD